jgi:murein DD-endopeptidase MepM/ murein hydrolase activator NlpD
MGNDPIDRRTTTEKEGGILMAKKKLRFLLVFPIAFASGYDTERGYGNFAQIEYGYQFEGFTYRTGIVGEYAHMKDVPLVNKEQFVSAGTRLGFVGNTGKSTGEHLRYSVYAKPGQTYAANAVSRIFGANYMDTAMTNNSKDKTVYDPLYFYNKYKGKY